MQVFAEILGVPQEDRRYIIELGDSLLGSQDPEYAQPTDDSHRLLPFSSPAALEMFEFGRKMAAARRKNPGNVWTLYGLLQAQNAQGKKDEAALTEERFKRASKDSDFTFGR